MKVGDKVVCIERFEGVYIYDNSPTGLPMPIKGEVYIISEVNTVTKGLHLKGFSSWRNFLETKFRKVQPAKTNRVTRELVKDFEVIERIEKREYETK